MYKRSQNPVRLPMTKVHTLFHPLKATQVYNGILNKQLQNQKQQSSKCQLHLSETQRLADDREPCTSDSKVSRPEYEDERGQAVEGETQL